MYQLSPEIKSQWAISGVSRLIFFTLVAVLLEYFVISDHVHKWFLADYIFSALVFCFFLLMLFIIPPLKYKYWKFDVRENEIYIERGVFTRIHTTAPYSRVQHIDVIQSILDRWLGLGKLVIYTAGTKGADILIPGLPIQYAEDLRDRLKNYTSEDAV